MSITSFTMIFIINLSLEIKVTPEDWQGLVKGLLKAELKRRNMGYKELVEKLAEFGIAESERNIANKISRGALTAVLLIQCLKAIGCHTIRITDA